MPRKLPVCHLCWQWNLLLAGAALLWGLTLGSSAASAQQPTAPVANAANASADKEQCSQGLGDGTTSKGGSDGHCDQTSESETAPPAYKLLRYEEDYSFLKDPSRRTDFWDPIKYIPLWERDDWHLSFGGEIRERYEIYHN